MATPASDPTDSFLGSTAHWTAAVRSLESAQAEPLFQDPWAAALAGEIGAAWLATRTADSVLPIVIRTRFFDDFLQRLAFQEGLRQIVLLAAGLDTRAFRLSWPDQTRIFELDQPGVLNYKEQTLAAAGARPLCLRQSIPADLTMSWQEALLKNGFDSRQPAAWLLEGFLFYIAREQGSQLLTEVTGLAAPGSWLGCDVVNAVMLTSPLTRKWLDMQAEAGAPWIGTLDDPATFLATLGWQATLTQAGQADANYGRWTFLVFPTNMPDMPHNWFVTARRD